MKLLGKHASVQLLSLLVAMTVSCSEQEGDEKVLITPTPSEGLVPVSIVEELDEQMGGKPYDGTYTYLFSDAFKVGHYQFFVLNSIGTIFESCFILDKRTDEFIEIEGFGQYMNKTAFNFFLLGEQNEQTYIGSYYLGGGTLSETWDLEILKVSEEGVELFRRIRLFHRNWDHPEDIETGGFTYLMHPQDSSGIEVGLLEGDLRSYNELNPMSEFDFGIAPDSILIEAEHHLAISPAEEGCEDYESEFNYHLDYLSEDLIVVGIDEIVKTGSWNYSKGSLVYQKEGANWQRLKFEPKQKDPIYFSCEPAYADRISGQLLHLVNDTLNGQSYLEFVQEYHYRDQGESRRKKILYGNGKLREMDVKPDF